jgi:hypothetical protein
MSRFHTEIKGRSIGCRQCGQLMGPINTMDEVIVCPEGHQWQYTWKNETLRALYLGQVIDSTSTETESPSVDSSGELSPTTGASMDKDREQLAMWSSLTMEPGGEPSSPPSASPGTTLPSDHPDSPWVWDPTRKAYVPLVGQPTHYPPID